MAALVLGPGLVLTPSAWAAPVVASDLTIVENRPVPDLLFGISGLHLLTRADVNPGNAPVTGVTVRSLGANNFYNSAVPLSPVPGSQSWLKLTSITVADFTSIMGQYRYRATDSNANADARDSHELDFPAVVPHPTNLMVSDYSTTPTFTFADPAPTTAYPLELTRWYDVVIFDSSGMQVIILDAKTDAMGTPSFDVPPGYLTAGQQYWFRAQSIDIDVEGATAYVENIGESLLSFTPAAVPESTHIAALGGVLVAWAGLHTRRKGR